MSDLELRTATGERLVAWEKRVGTWHQEVRRLASALAKVDDRLGILRGHPVVAFLAKNNTVKDYLERVVDLPAFWEVDYILVDGRTFFEVHGRVYENVNGWITAPLGWKRFWSGTTQCHDGVLLHQRRDGTIWQSTDGKDWRVL